MMTCSGPEGCIVTRESLLCNHIFVNARFSNSSVPCIHLRTMLHYKQHIYIFDFEYCPRRVDHGTFPKDCGCSIADAINLRSVIFTFQCDQQMANKMPNVCAPVIGTTDDYAPLDVIHGDDGNATPSLPSEAPASASADLGIRVACHPSTHDIRLCRCTQEPCFPAATIPHWELRFRYFTGAVWALLSFWWLDGVLGNKKRSAVVSRIPSDRVVVYVPCNCPAVA